MFLNSKSFLVVFCLCFCLGLSPAEAWDKTSARSVSHYMMGVIYEDLEDFDQAIQEYQKAIQFSAQNTSARFKLASSYFKKNDLPAAITQLKLVVTDDVDDVQAHALLSLIYSLRQEEAPALAEFEIALKNASALAPENVEVYKCLGDLYFRQNKLVQARGMYKLITGLNPDDPEGYFYLASVEYELKNFPEAEIAFKSALKLNPDYHQALNSLGYAYLEKNKNINAAGKMIKKALKLDPENPAYLDSLGWFYFKKGKFSDAKIQLEKASALLEDPVIFDHLGDFYFKTGDLKNAGSSWKHSLELDSLSEPVKQKLEKLKSHEK
ncbi:MAG: tetratricopeptide repeat protein [Candidatus Omnitrophica bacterium]|nr:tetratricopeptide repeat protein [Candidatus Omnitrophota bacterium]